MKIKEAHKTTWQQQQWKKDYKGRIVRANRHESGMSFAEVLAEVKRSSETIDRERKL